MHAGLVPIADVSVGAWIAERLGGPVGTVGSVVPRGFPAYARVLHPVEVADDRPPLTWAQVCRLTGRIPHALMQWAAITAPVSAGTATARSGRWDDGSVRVGRLAPSALSALIDVLAPATGGRDCVHALWEGWGWVGGGSSVRALSSRTDGRPVPAPAPEPGVSAEVWALPRLRLPHRDYLLFRGSLRAALDLGWWGAPDWFLPQSPSLLWPVSQSWCLGTEIDFDSTLVGGSADLVSAILGAPGLEAWSVEPDDDLTAFADRLNSRP